MTLPRQYRAGQSVEDHCRSCHEDRTHTVIVVDAHAQPLRVACDFCRSEHNFRGGARNEPRAAHVTDSSPRRHSTFVPAQSASIPMTQPVPDSDFEALIRRIIREETGLTPVAPAEKWRGGELVLKPGKPGVQEKS